MTRLYEITQTQEEMKLARKSMLHSLTRTGEQS